ncbi:hypothetical protein SAY87_013152 [Trapa incisa]|uniref:Uncharacterized protein n=1 Tax=Trapa incisa TaxID=236973 RepID=A0AAN7QCR6_9MYRT|nr:hypothetical protein SAY87_013152 [Trapa incisa]
MDRPPTASSSTGKCWENMGGLSNQAMAFTHLRNLNPQLHKIKAAEREREREREQSNSKEQRWALGNFLQVVAKNLDVLALCVGSQDQHSALMTTYRYTEEVVPASKKPISLPRCQSLLCTAIELVICC